LTGQKNRAKKKTENKNFSWWELFSGGLFSWEQFSRCGGGFFGGIFSCYLKQ